MNLALQHRPKNAPSAGSREGKVQSLLVLLALVNFALLQ